VAETSFTIPGTQVKLPRWALLAGAAGLAGVLLLRPKGQASGAVIDQSEGSLGEAEGAAGAAGGGEDVAGYFQQLAELIAAQQQQQVGSLVYPSSGGTVAASGGFVSAGWDPGLLGMETPSPGSPHEDAIIREEESPALASGIGDTLATGTRVTQAEKREQQAVMTGKRGQRDAAQATRDLAASERATSFTRAGESVQQAARVAAKTVLKPLRAQALQRAPAGQLQRWVPAAPVSQGKSAKVAAKPQSQVDRWQGTSNYMRTARGTRIYRRSTVTASSKGTYAT